MFAEVCSQKRKVTVRNLSPHEEKAAQSHPGITEHRNAVTRCRMSETEMMGILTGSHNMPIA